MNTFKNHPIKTISKSEIQSKIDKIHCLDKSLPDALIIKELRDLLFYGLFYGLPKISYLSVLRTRCHTIDNLNSAYVDVKELTYRPPKSIIKRGRMNLDKKSIFYACHTPDVMGTLMETTFNSYTPHAGTCTILEAELKKETDLKILNFYKPANINNKRNNDIYISFLEKEKEQFLKYFSSENIEKISLINDFITNELLTRSKTRSQKGRRYKLSSCISHILFNNFHADIIIYPSAGMNNHTVCYAIKPSVIDKHFSYKSAMIVDYEYTNKDKTPPLNGRLFAFAKRRKSKLVRPDGYIIYNGLNDN